MTVISSRTPEGQPNRCPVCRGAVRVEPSLPLGDAPCPRCGHLLWFIRFEERSLYFEHADAAPIRRRIEQLIAERRGVAVKQLLATWIKDGVATIESSELDSLDVVAIVVMLDEEFRI